MTQYRQNNPDKIKQYNLHRKQNKKHKISKKEWESCKEYFNNSCAYCGISNEDAKKKYKNYLHKEHVDYNGANDLSNCVPACKSCNSLKWEYTLEDWYNKNNSRFTQERLDKIYKWLNKDYKNYIIQKINKR